MRLLLLAGTAEARQIARALAQAPRLGAVASLAGSTRSPEPLGIPTRIGGFGGRAAFRDWLERERVRGVLDATHPFSVEMSRRTADVCAELEVPYVLFVRPPWLPGEGDRWTFLNAPEEAARHIPEDATVFLATGPQTLEQFANLAGRTVWCRRIDPTPDPFPMRGGWVHGRPPYRLDDELELFARLGVDWLVVKNSGGAAGRTKLDAARLLELPVAVLRRPMQPDAPRVTTVAAALAWARSLP